MCDGFVEDLLLVSEAYCLDGKPRSEEAAVDFEGCVEASVERPEDAPGACCGGGCCCDEDEDDVACIEPLLLAVMSVDEPAMALLLLGVRRLTMLAGAENLAVVGGGRPFARMDEAVDVSRSCVHVDPVCFNPSQSTCDSRSLLR